MDWKDYLAIASAALSVAGLIVAITRYIVQLQFKIQQEQLTLAKQQSEQRINDLEAQNNHLLNSLTASHNVGAIISAKLSKIEQQLDNLISITAASAGSIYLPLRDNDNQQISGLVFLAVSPINQQTLKLKKRTIPITSIAGTCFTSNLAQVIEKNMSDQHFTSADQVSGFSTENSLNLPISLFEQPIAVIQLLNKKNKQGFVAQDLTIVESLITPLKQSVSEFIQLPNYADILGINQSKDNHACVMLCDLSHSSKLFQTEHLSTTVQYINEYLENMCTIAFNHGASLDKYLGDGVLFRFNEAESLDKSPKQALSAAKAMQEKFNEIKLDWCKMDNNLNSIFNRIAISYGEVIKANLGHPQHQSVTILGKPVNNAAALCQIASRSSNVIIVDQQFYQQLEPQPQVLELAKEQLDKVSRYSNTAYNIQF